MLPSPSPSTRLVVLLLVALHLLVGIAYLRHGVKTCRLSVLARRGVATSLGADTGRTSLFALVPWTHGAEFMPIHLSAFSRVCQQPDCRLMYVVLNNATSGNAETIDKTAELLGLPVIKTSLPVPTYPSSDHAQCLNKGVHAAVRGFDLRDNDVLMICDSDAFPLDVDFKQALGDADMMGLPQSRTLRGTFVSYYWPNILLFKVRGERRRDLGGSAEPHPIGRGRAGKGRRQPAVGKGGGLDDRLGVARVVGLQHARDLSQPALTPHADARARPRAGPR